LRNGGRKRRRRRKRNIRNTRNIRSRRRARETKRTVTLLCISQIRYQLCWLILCTAVDSWHGNANLMMLLLNSWTLPGA